MERIDFDMLSAAFCAIAVIAFLGSLVVTRVGRAATLTVPASPSGSALDARLAELNTRLSVLEIIVKHMPTHNDLTQIQTQLSGLSAKVAVVDERSEATHVLVQSISNHLLESSS